MKLRAGQNITLELDAAGYQFPDIRDSDLDSNWLIVHGKIEHPLGSWSFSYPCLTTAEVERLTGWFEAIAQGQMGFTSLSRTCNFPTRPHLRPPFMLDLRRKAAPDGSRNANEGGRDRDEFSRREQ